MTEHPDASAELPVSAEVSAAAGRRRGRILGGIILAAAPTAVPMVASVLSGEATHLSWRLGMVCLGAVGIWLIGGIAIVWLRKGYLRLFECLALGLLLGFLLPAASIAVSGLIQQAMSSEAHSVASTFRGLGFQPLVSMGVTGLPFGLLGGWLFWRLARRSVIAAIARSEKFDPSLHRRWPDLSKRRLACGLLAAGAPWTLANLAYTAFAMRGAELVGALPVALIATEFWFLALGLLYLFAFSRRRGSVARTDCLLLGILLTSFYPVYGIGFSLAFGVIPAGIPADASLIVVALAIVLFGLLLTPIGLLSGWLFWRVGVRPARPKDMASAPIFD
ncbi:hypothetical protein [Dongia sp.]|uniref:hypothetical protein n=1 Tax=Dongia sp. TaxID=1977262 RepID=UPI003752756F